MNNAKYVSFRSDQNLDQVPAGSTFQAIWTMQNHGSTTWDANYKVAHIHAAKGSAQLTGKASYTLAEVGSSANVRPGDQVVITLEMKAPDLVGRRYFTDWQLQDPQGKLFGEIIWLRLVTSKPVATTPPSGFRESNSKYIDDHTIPDGTPFEEGASFLKQWAVKNTGTRKWNSAYRLVFVDGDRGMSGSMTHIVPEAEPGEQVMLSIPMMAPPARTEAYISSWRLYDDRNTPFGDHFWVKIFSTAKAGGLGIKPYSQNDPQWKNNQLGRGSQTMGQFGCLLSCMAMMLTGFGETYTPWTLNQAFLRLAQGFGFDGSNVYFNAPNTLISHVNFHGNWKPYPETGATFADYDPNLIARIDHELAIGSGVIIQVDMDPVDPYTFGQEQHWVFVLGRQGNDYLVLDPINGHSISLLAKYGQQTKPQDSIETLKGAIKSALIYRSTRTRIAHDDPGTAQTPQKNVGISHVGSDVIGELEYTGPKWQFDHMLKGVHDRANRHPQDADYAIVNGRFESVKISSGITIEELNKYKVPFFLCRLFESWNGRDVPAPAFVNTVVNDIERLVNAGVEYFEFHNEPNLTHEGLRARGVAGSWANGAEFAQYFIQGQKLLKQRFPNIKVGFPGLSPGPDAAYEFGHDKGFRMNDWDFLEGAISAVQAADFLCVHAYYVSLEEVSTEAIALVKKYRKRFPDKLIFVTEFSNPDPQKKIGAVDKGQQAKEFYRQCAQIPGVGAAYYFIVSGSGWDHQALRRDSDGRSLGVIEAMF